MPLVVVCGLPGSGKSSVARRIAERLSNRKVCIVSDDDTGETRDEMYRDSAAEKRTRSLLKASLQRLLTDETVVIADSLNYIKGFRYELFCVAREIGTQLSLVYCMVSPDEARRRNATRAANGGDSYAASVIDGLLTRFEAPSELNRWERPMFCVETGAESAPPLDLDGLTRSLFDARQSLHPNKATARREVQSTGTLQDVDRALGGVERSLAARLTDAHEGEALPVPPATHRVVLQRKPTVAEVKRLRRAYMKLANIKPSADQSIEQLANQFVDYVNDQLRA